MTDDEIVASARACVGARFRLHGRSVAGGLDCVGVVALAYRLGEVPGGYALRGGDAGTIADRIAACGFVARNTDTPATLLLIAPGPFQHHLAIRTDRGFVHADARLRRVVETPGVPGWPVVVRFRQGD